MCGKTTTAKLILKLENPTGGNIYLDGRGHPIIPGTGTPGIPDPGAGSLPRPLVVPESSE